MNIRNIFGILGVLLISIGLILIAPLSISIINNDGAQSAFISTIIITLISGILLNILKIENPVIEKKEAISTVVIGWVLVSIAGALPFYFSGYFPGFLDSLFESVSGFTTTGASILSDIEKLPHSLLLWRSLTHWLGGMGIIIFVLIVLPLVNVGTRNLYNYESSSIAQERLTPRVALTARMLWFVYFSLTILETILLKICGISFFDSLLTAFGTIPTGGFSPRNLSIAAYNNVYVEIIVMIFMVLSGINFSFYLILVKPDKKFANFREIILFYLGFMLLCSFIVSVDLFRNVYGDWCKSLRYGFFQVISISTTTGFVTADYEKWSPVTHIVLLILMMIGACPGSTTGAIKNSRIIILFKSIYREVLHFLHPRMLKPIRLNNKVVDENTIKSAVTYIGLYFYFLLFAVLLMTLKGIDIRTAIYSVATTLGGVGPGLGLTGPMSNYLGLPAFCKYILIIAMLLGRLEFYSILVMFSPKFWKKF